MWAHFVADPGSAHLLQIPGSPQQVHAGALIFEIRILIGQIAFAGLHLGVGQFVIGAGLGLNARLSRLAGRVGQFVLQFGDLARGFQLFGGAP